MDKNKCPKKEKPKNSSKNECIAYTFLYVVLFLSISK
jgi:hypothetical protein